MNYVALSAVAIIAVWTCDTVRAAEVTLIAPGGIRAAVQQMIPNFERATGHKVTATFGSGGGTKQQVIRGKPFDVPIVQLPLDPVMASGHVVAASETPLATVAVGVAVRTGVASPTSPPPMRSSVSFSARKPSPIQMLRLARPQA
jgi:molybdate transport system substrate-binding protein